MDEQKRPACQTAWLGSLPYQTAWDLQNTLAAEIAAGKRADTLLLLEHPHTFTIGRRGGWEHVLWDEQERQKNGILLVEVDRGGDVTYHGPGQLVGYPLLNLAGPGWNGSRLPQADFVGYLRKLESTLIAALAALGVEAFAMPGLTGVWVDLPEQASKGKIASIGVKVDARGISRHGFALNVRPQMRYWDGIIACGLDGVRMVSMEELSGSNSPSMQAVRAAVCNAFADEFDRPLEEVTISIPEVERNPER